MLYARPPGRRPATFGNQTRKVPKGKAYGYRRRFGLGGDLGPLANKAMPKGLTDPSDASRSFGPTHPSDASRQAFIPNERMLNDPQVRMELMRRLRTRRKSGDRFKAMGI